jgi:hypothetical protein
MANTLTLSAPTPAGVPADGWTVGYKILGSGGPYTIAGPFMSMPINIGTADAVGTLYEGYITRDCGTLESTQFFWQTPCSCVNAGVGYVTAPNGTQCELVETEEPDITNSGYCLATSQNAVYSQYGTRIYTPGFTESDMQVFPLTTVGFHRFGSKTTGVWINGASNITDGPMNREGVWIDSDCDGNKDPLGVGVQTTVSYVYNNAGVARDIYLGVAADNIFTVVVNGVTLVTFDDAGDMQFKTWHIIPISMVVGPNYINVIGTGDGGVNDAMAMVVYDNTAAEILAATSDLDLNIPFASHTLRGTSFDVATCSPGFSLDTSGGSGNYICVRTTYAACNQL